MNLSDQGQLAVFTLRMLAVPMVLHGLYDTLLKKDMNVSALGIAVVTFGWLAIQIEMARSRSRGRGAVGKRGRRLAY